MRNKNKILLIILLCIILSLTSCNTKSFDDLSKLNSTTSYKDMPLTLENHMNYLTSTECDGRRLGTNGNIKAQNYIRYCLEQYNITPYTDSYNSQFSYNCTDIKKINVNFNGKALEQNKDYIIKSVLRNYNKYNFKSTISTDNSGEIVMFEQISNNELIKYSYDHEFKVVLQSIDMLRNPLDSINKKYDWIGITLKSDIYESLKNGDILEIEYEYEDINKTDNNIIGIIKSNQETNNALVLSAHFDHMGSIDNNLFCGALDNASGTACLLDLAQNLSANIDTSKLNCDIVFAFFNAEEGALLGSKEFSKQISQQYSNVININFDCVGGKEHDAVAFNLQNDKVISIYEKVSEQLEIYKSGDFTSDHCNFQNGIGISTYNSSIEEMFTDTNMHTTLDTLDNVNIEFIKTLSDKFKKIITDLSTDEHTFCIYESDEEIFNNIYNQSNVLSFGEYKYIDTGKNIETVAKLYCTSTENSILEYFINDYKKLIFDNVTLSFDKNIIPTYNSNCELNKIYKISLEKLTVDDLNDVDLMFYNENENIHLSIHKYTLNDDPYLQEILTSQYINNYTSIKKSDCEYFYDFNGSKNEIFYYSISNNTMYCMNFIYFKSTGKDNEKKYEQITSDEMFKMMDEYQITELLDNIKNKIEK